MKAICGVLLLAGVLVKGEIIDRIAVVVENGVIAESEVIQQIRLAAFQNGETPDYSAGSKRDAADKLVDQELIRREIEASRYVLPVNTANQLMDELKKRHGGEEQFFAALRNAHLSEEDLKAQLLWQVTLINFVESRFRPGVQIPEPEIEDYYRRTYLPERRKTKTESPPRLEEARDAIEEILLTRLADQALDGWLGSVRRQTKIRYREEVFR